MAFFRKCQEYFRDFLILHIHAEIRECLVDAGCLEGIDFGSVFDGVGVGFLVPVGFWGEGVGGDLGWCDGSEESVVRLGTDSGFGPVESESLVLSGIPCLERSDSGLHRRIPTE